VEKKPKFKVNNKKKKLYFNEDYLKLDESFYGTKTLNKNNNP
jgi:hypothetical protein